MQEIQQSTRLERHIAHLQQVHDDLDKQIQEEYLSYGEDRLVTILKKKKLQLKDEIENFKKQLEIVGEGSRRESLS